MQQEGIGYRFACRITDYYQHGPLLGKTPSGKDVVIKEHHMGPVKSYSLAKYYLIGEIIPCEIVSYEGDVAIARQLTPKDFRKR